MTRYTIASDAAPDYLGTLGLERPPFLEHTDDSFFYADPVLMQRLDLLQHLTQFGDMMLGITGPTGSGKTTLLQQFALRVHDNWRLCRVDGGRITHPQELLSKVAQDLGADVSGDLERTRATLLRHCQGLHHKTQLVVIVIDNAELLPVPALQALIELTGDPKETLKLIRVLLFATPDLEQKLIQAGVHSPQHPLLHVLEIPRFDEQQTAAYLMYRLAVAGYSGDSPFSMTEIRAMHKAADGLPAKLNVLAHETLLERAGRIASRQRIGASLAAAKPATARSRFVAPVVAVAGLGVVGWLIVQTGVLQQQSEREEQALVVPPLAPVPTTTPPPGPVVESDIKLDETPIISQPTEITEVSPKTPASEETRELAAIEPAAPAPEHLPSAPSPTLAAPPPTAQASAEPAPSSEPPIKAPAAIDKPTEVPTPAPVQAAAEAPAPEPTALPAATPEPPPAAVRSPDIPGVLGEDWLQARPADHFTLQLLGVRSLESLKKFLVANKIPAPVAYFQTEFKGGDWFVLLQGDYASKDAARAGIKSLPAKLQRDKPWPRSFASVHADLE